MEIIARSTDHRMAGMLDSYEHPAILVSADYEVLATNDLYRDKFGEIDATGTARCYQVSHGYDRPCDEAGEDCPLAAAKASGHRERVLHIHQTPRGEEHVDVEMLPILDEKGKLQFFVELLKPIAVAGIYDPDTAMVGASRAFNDMLEMIARVAPGDAAVLLLGESGCGKELAAQALHQASGRSDRPMVTLECAGLTETLFESELFGHEKGAFTGANYRKQGLVEAAHGGTLFLDEVGDIPLAMQVKLLRLIETGTYRPVGSVETNYADFRLVCATHKDLSAMVDAGAFRQDLFYRINVFPIRVPSLSERLEDLPLLANALLGEVARGRSYHLTESAMTLLKQHRYRGNIRELRNILARAVVIADTNVLDRSVIARCLDSGAETTIHDESLKAAEQRHLARLMQQYGGDKQRVADAAGISVRSLYRKLGENDRTDARAGRR